MAEDIFDKPFAFSYSALKNFETCPLRHLEIDLTKRIVEPETASLKWGNELHAAMASAIETDDNHHRHPRDTIEPRPLPDAFMGYKPWVDRIRQVRESKWKVYTELKIALNREFRRVPYFDRAAYLRVIVDVFIMSPDQRFGVAWDWKTGKRMMEPVQLSLNAMALMSMWRTLEVVKTEYVFLAEMRAEDPFSCVDSRTYERQHVPGIWNFVAPRVRNLEEARRTRNYPPNPSGLCKRHCPVHTCAHHGGKR